MVWRQERIRILLLLQPEKAKKITRLSPGDFSLG